MSKFFNSGENALGPEDEVYVLDISKLRTGDVILTASPGQIESIAIRLFTWAHFSHALLVTRPPDAMESADGGVIRFRLDRMCVRNPDSIAVLRVKAEYSFDAELLVKTAESQMGVPYADNDAVTTILPMIAPVDRGSFFCSQLVAYCLIAAGLEICPGIPPSKTTPADIKRSSRLRELDNDEVLKKMIVRNLGFSPYRLDAPNQQTLPDELNLKGQKAIEKIQEKFRLHGLEVFSREQAMMAVGRAWRDNKPYAEEIDRALADAYREIDIPGTIRSQNPADDPSNILDLILAREIAKGRFTKQDASFVIDFYEQRLEIAKDTLQDRQDFVVAERGAYLLTGSEATRLHLAAEVEVFNFHRQSFEISERVLMVLKLFAKHEGDPRELMPRYLMLLVPELNDLVARRGG
jgi:hypothetical protein